MFITFKLEATKLNDSIRIVISLFNNIYYRTLPFIRIMIEESEVKRERKERKEIRSKKKR